MNQSNSILIVEIKTVTQAQFNPNQVSPITVYQQSDRSYLDRQSLKQIELAVIAALPRLGSNYRHPLLFDVQVVPGDKIDALIASVENARARIRRQRTTR
ncbi:MAG: hypothetical protein HC764_18450 [Pleurocapsa sp. CRU_1_2]|nr:hypothetical protein [Pleurocapsa sp. CRU_1_2]